MDASKMNTRQALEAQLIGRAMQDETFRQALLRDPKGVFAREGGGSRYRSTSPCRCWRKAPPPSTSCCLGYRIALAWIWQTRNSRASLGGFMDPTLQTVDVDCC